MRVLDFRVEDPPAAVGFAVVGSGPAGMTVASELARHGHDVLVIESGPDAESLSATEIIGHPRVQPESLVRRRELGGTSRIWSGRCIPLDALDFAVREWVPFSGWPITAEELAGPLARAASILGLGEQEYGEGVWRLLKGRAGVPLNRALLREVFWQFSRTRNGASGPTRFDSDVDMTGTVLVGATATRLLCDHSGTVTSIEVASSQGKRASISVGTVIVAAGAIETPRLLLASHLGNDLVGRFLMDHPGVAIATIPATSSVRDRFGTYWRRSRPARLAYANGLALSPELQQAEGLLTASCWLDEHPASDDPWQAGLRLTQRLSGRTAADPQSAEFWRTYGRGAPVAPSALRDILSVLRHPLLLAAGVVRLLRGRPPLYKADRVDLYAIVEQEPDPDSRITLSERSDALGTPLAQVDWRVHDSEFRAVRRLLEVVTDQFVLAGFEPPQAAACMANAEAWRAKVRDRAHQLGTTRMAELPTHGAVDPDCLLFGTRNVWVTGGSVFPTTGHANPTLTIVALAVRLADHLNSRANTPDQAAPSR